MARGMHKGPRTTRLGKRQVEGEKPTPAGNNWQSDKKDKKTSLSKRVEAFENIVQSQLKTVMHRPGSNKK